MALSSLLLLSLAAGPPVSEEAREAPRVRAGIHLAGAAGFSGFAFGGGPGLSVELGATFADRYSVVARLTVGTLIAVMASSATLALDVALNDRLSLGAGFSVGLVGGLLTADLPLALAAAAPGLRPLRP